MPISMPTPWTKNQVGQAGGSLTTRKPNNSTATARPSTRRAPLLSESEGHARRPSSPLGPYIHCQNSHSLLRTLFKCTIMTSEHRKAIFAFDIVNIQNNRLITKSNHRLLDQTVDHHHPKIYLVEQIPRRV